MTFNNVLESVIELPVEQQESLVEIVRNRIIDNRRDEIAYDAKTSIKDARNGRYKSESSKELIERLHNSINQNE